MHFSRTLNMQIQAIRMRWGRGNNYSYIVVDDKSKQATIIDPAEPDEVSDSLDKLKENNIKLTSIMNTHHHYDHAGGNEKLHMLYPELPIIAGEESPLVTKTPKDRETLKLGDDILITALHTPCHTQDSISWFFQDSKTNQKAVFTGDTLFIAGCGRFFEGTATEMANALKKIASLPGDTVIYPGHEYTKDNLSFVHKVLDNKAVSSLTDYVSKHDETTGVFTIKDELEYNPFLRLTDPQVMKATGASSEVEVMHRLREMKNAS